jgi:hypothetical protein
MINDKIASEWIFVKLQQFEQLQKSFLNNFETVVKMILNNFETVGKIIFFKV